MADQREKPLILMMNDDPVSPNLPSRSRDAEDDQILEAANGSEALGGVLDRRPGQDAAPTPTNMTTAMGGHPIPHLRYVDDAFPLFSISELHDHHLPHRTGPRWFHREFTQPVICTGVTLCSRRST